MQLFPMYTLSEISLAVARIVMPDQMVDGEATAGSVSSLTDTANLTQPNEYFKGGILWLHSGAHAGEVYAVASHAVNKLNFTAVTGAIAAGDRYTVARDIYTYQKIKAAINTALTKTHIESTDTSLEGDGETLAFTLPSGVWDVKRVFFTDPDRLQEQLESTHWEEKYIGTARKLLFDRGYAPKDGYTINVVYRDQHPALTTYSSEINSDIDIEWLKYKAAEDLLLFGMGAYGSRVEFRIEERMNIVMEHLKRLRPRGTDIIIHTAGG